MLTGDNPRTAAAVAAAVGISDFRAGLLPGDKATAVRDLQAAGHRTLMAGDGINDAPAVTHADIGIAMGAGTDIAIESADIVLTGSRLSAVADARDIAVGSFRKTRQNLAVALAFNGIGVPLAVTGLLAPAWAMIAIIASVSTVLANSFGTRLRPRSFVLLGRWLGQVSRELSPGCSIRRGSPGWPGGPRPPATSPSWPPRPTLGTAGTDGAPASPAGAEPATWRLPEHAGDDRCLDRRQVQGFGAAHPPVGQFERLDHHPFAKSAAGKPKRSSRAPR